MLAVVLGLLVAASYGSGDFFGGISSRALPAGRVVVWSQAVGLLGLLAMVPVLGGSPVRSDLLTGAAAGACGLTGVVLLYRGLALGRMAVVAPVTAVGAALVPFVAGVVRGDDVTVARIFGALAALAGVVLISLPAQGGPAGDPEEPVGASGPGALVETGLAIAAGLAFGIVFVLLAEVRPEAGIWPVVAQRLTSVPLGALVLAVTRPAQLRPPLAHARTLVPAGLFDAGANGLFLYAAARGDLSVVGVVSSLYPAATILLAAAVLHERIARLQGLGLLVAATGVVLLAA